MKSTPESQNELDAALTSTPSIKSSLLSDSLQLQTAPNPTPPLKERLRKQKAHDYSKIRRVSIPIRKEIVIRSAYVLISKEKQSSLNASSFTLNMAREADKGGEAVENQSEEMEIAREAEEEEDSDGFLHDSRSLWLQKQVDEEDLEEDPEAIRQKGGHRIGDGFTRYLQTLEEMEKRFSELPPSNVEIDLNDRSVSAEDIVRLLGLPL